MKIRILRFSQEPGFKSTRVFQIAIPILPASVALNLVDRLFQEIRIKVRDNQNSILQSGSSETISSPNSREEEILGEQSFLQQAVDVLAQTSDVLAAVRALVTQNGGHWDDDIAQDECVLFEIHLFGVAGVGLGAEGAARNWLVKARAEIRSSSEPA